MAHETSSQGSGIVHWLAPTGTLWLERSDVGTETVVGADIE
jgi:hypothetical protein